MNFNICFINDWSWKPEYTTLSRYDLDRNEKWYLFWWLNIYISISIYE